MALVLKSGDRGLAAMPAPILFCAWPQRCRLRPLPRGAPATCFAATCAPARLAIRPFMAATAPRRLVRTRAAPLSSRMAPPFIPTPILGLSQSIAPLLDLAGLAVFAVSGALAAARRGQTLVTLCFFALITGVGGGTVRDLLIGAPVFWLQDSRAAATCLAMAVLIWVTPERWWRGTALDWFDAVGLAAYAVYGAAKALGHGVPIVPAMVMGVISACVGGIIRDVLAGEPSIIMRPEIYVTAAALAAGLYVSLVAIGVAPAIAAIIAALAGFGLRGLAIGWKLALPAYRRSD